MSRALTTLVALVLVGISAACTEDPKPNATPGDLVLPLQEPTRIFMEALLEGELVRRGDCLYVIQDYDQSRVLPIWPHGFSYEAAGDEIYVLDRDGHRVARVGHPIEMGGGMDGEGRDHLIPELRDEVDGCGGPYWIVGAIPSSSDL